MRSEESLLITKGKLDVNHVDTTSLIERPLSRHSGRKEMEFSGRRSIDDVPIAIHGAFCLIIDANR